MIDSTLIERIMEIEAKSERREIKSYAIRGNVLSENEKELIAKERKYLVFNESEKLDFSSLFENSNDTVIEIGFGSGDATAEIALKNPNTNYLAVEVYLHGIVNLLRRIGDGKIENIRVIRWDASELLKTAIPDSSVSGFHIFFPDPWPKKRHHKRRLLKSDFLALLSCKLKEDGYIYIATDWHDYANSILEEAERVETLKNESSSFSERPSWRPITRFEKKGLESGNNIFEIVLKKRR